VIPFAAPFVDNFGGMSVHRQECYRNDTEERIMEVFASLKKRAEVVCIVLLLFFVRFVFK